MYREPPDFDSRQWLAVHVGARIAEYMDNADNITIYDVNTIANYDPEIIPFLDAPSGSAFARNPDTGEFEEEAFHPFRP